MPAVAVVPKATAIQYTGDNVDEVLAAFGADSGASAVPAGDVVEPGLGDEILEGEIALSPGGPPFGYVRVRPGQWVLLTWFSSTFSIAREVVDDLDAYVQIPVSS